MNLMPGTIRISIAALAAAVLLLMPYAHAEESPEREIQSVLHMLDYLSVDYGGSVLYGAVINEREYREQTEFAGQSVKLLSSLPASPQQAMLFKEAQELNRLVLAKGQAEQVSASAQLLRKEIIAAYNVAVSPRHNPDFRRATVLYQQYCARCHGIDGHGDGPDGRLLTPKPSNFHDEVRMDKRSVYGLFNAISLGVARTEMPQFSHLSEEDRWALAFLAANFHTKPDRLSLGKELWEQRNFQGTSPDLLMLATQTANEISANHGENAKAVFEYLRTEPQALGTVRRATLIFAGEQLDQALARYRAGNQVEAQRFAIDAYLEGFEPMEIGLSNLNEQLRLDIEHEMTAIRQLIYGGAPTESVAMKVELVKSMLRQADELLRGGRLTINGAFASSFFIMLNKGLLVILMLPVILVFVARSERRSSARSFIHAGWGGALMLGVLTWGMAAWLANIPGSVRAVISSITALIAAALLVYAWFWLQDRSHTRAWQQFLKDRIGIVLEKKALYALAMLSFIVGYRGVFEAVLSYQALWAQTSDITRSALWSGALAGGLALVVISWVVYHFCFKLPIRIFFSSASVLFAVIVIALTGQSIASLQEAGMVASRPVPFVAFPALGVLPTVQTLMAQLLAIGILIVCFLLPIWQQRSHDRPA